MDLKQAARNTKIFLRDNSSLILTCMSVVGTVTTAIMASQATLKARDILYDNGAENLPWQDKVRLTWKVYVPTVLMGMVTVGSEVGNHITNQSQKATLQSAYLLSQATLQEYQKKVVDRIGANKERQVYDEAVKAVADKQSPTVLYSQNDINTVYETGHGNSLFYDVPGERYFKSDINFIDAQVNAMNHDVRTEMWYDWNEIYYRWGLPMKPLDGTEMIFDVDRPLEVTKTSEIMENNQVRILLNYKLYPRSTYRERG